jgi:hypothetical protein
MIGHHGKTMKLEAASITIAEDRRDEKVGVCRALKVAMLLEGRDRDRVCAQMLGSSALRKAYPRG